MTRLTAGWALGWELEADYYIAKPFSPRELVARACSHYFAAQCTTPIPLARAPVTAPVATPIFGLDEDGHQIRFYGRTLELSRYEYGVLRMLAQKPGRAFTRMLYPATYCCRRLRLPHSQRTARGTSRPAPLALLRSRAIQEGYWLPGARVRTH